MITSIELLLFRLLFPCYIRGLSIKDPAWYWQCIDKEELAECLPVPILTPVKNNHHHHGPQDDSHHHDAPPHLPCTSGDMPRWHTCKIQKLGRNSEYYFWIPLLTSIFVKVLKDLPGYGWDNLDNSVRLAVFKNNFSVCEMTQDKTFRYLN